MLYDHPVRLTLAALLGFIAGELGRDREPSEEVLAVIQTRYAGGRARFRSKGSGEKWPDFEYIWQPMLTANADG